MKTLAIFAMFVAASVLPILFVPLLALTLLTLMFLAPNLLTNHVWGKTKEDIEQEEHYMHP